MKKWLKRIGIVIIIILVGIQLIPVSRTNPAITREVKWDAPATRTLAQRACFDCHSNETTWPWYGYVAPISWRLADTGRDSGKSMFKWEGIASIITQYTDSRLHANT